MLPTKGLILCAAGGGSSSSGGGSGGDSDDGGDDGGGDDEKGGGGGGGDDISRRLSSVFGEFGYEVVRGQSVEAVLRLASAGTYVLCVVDPDFDNGSGLPLCSELRSCNRLAPVILYSGSHGEEAEQAGINAGALAYVLKPNFDHLLLAILHALPRENHDNNNTAPLPRP